MEQTESKGQLVRWQVKPLRISGAIANHYQL